MTVTDSAILEAIPFLARHSGVLGEPAAAAGLAGLSIGLEEGLVETKERIVLLVTGHGLKDIPAASRSVSHPEPVEAHLQAVADRLGI